MVVNPSTEKKTRKQMCISINVWTFCRNKHSQQSTYVYFNTINLPWKHQVVKSVLITHPLFKWIVLENISYNNIPTKYSGQVHLKHLGWKHR